ncbi:flagellar biosynthesis protein FlhF [Pseudidiomarina aestuarii]|uniref:Flagellar biosynthesis protein FlhF n=1 Tax=Pseudidiomarina aestuarii TaxID=624146 RepID=A0A7Z7EUV1_9GAMM|nr:flagellar biosynthesis protein FlhF [Pseudidiomarina aestuarii]RUO42129.1 flagellar biosynthesis protein FlhF [Pseudidiomarina aestuarii]
MALVQKFIAANQREAMRQVREKLGDDAVILSTRPNSQGVLVLAALEADLDQLAPETAATSVDVTKVTQQLLTEMQALRAEVAELRSTTTAGTQDKALAEDQKSRLYRRLRIGGFSHELSRQIVSHMPGSLNVASASQADIERWVREQISARIAVAEVNWPILDATGVVALVGPTGVGKTTTTAKLAAQYVMRHGADSLLLVTTDSYRVGAQQQLEVYADILNVDMHPLRDGDSLSALAEPMKGKRLILVDTVGMSQRDQRLPSKIAALQQSQSSQLVLLLNAAAQPTTLDEVARIYRRIAQESDLQINDCIITKVDECTHSGGVLDVICRHQFQVQAISSGQRVPEDFEPPHIESLLNCALGDATQASAQEQQAWQLELPQQFNASRLVDQGQSLQFAFASLQQLIPDFALVTQAYQLGQVPPPRTERTPPAVRWAAPQPLQGWSQRTATVALSQGGLPMLSASWCDVPEFQSAELQLFDYLPDVTELSSLTSRGCGWLATVNVNHRLAQQGQVRSASEIIKRDGVPLQQGAEKLVYRGETRTLRLKIAAVDGVASDAPWQLCYGELQGGKGKAAVQRRYWILDANASVDDLVARTTYSLQLEELGRLQRFAWQQLDGAPSELRQWLAAAIAASAIHLEYSLQPQAARLRADLLALSGKRGRVDGSKLVSGMIRVLSAHQALREVSAGIQAESTRGWSQHD